MNSNATDAKSSSNEQTATTDNERKRNLFAITPTQTILLTLATVTDMYGPSSDLIGRRSFGGYHKSVQNTWDEALRRRTEVEKKMSQKEKVSDEELLRRYEKYVKKERGGEGDGEGGGRKDKRKRKL